MSSFTVLAAGFPAVHEAAAEVESFAKEVPL
jgi:hypothetical protein